MKRYVVFAGDRTYAEGGACDYVMSFTKFAEAISYRNQLAQRKNSWSHVWDTKEHKIYPDVEEDDYGYSCGIA